MSETAKSASWHEDVTPGEAEQFQAYVAEINRFQHGFARSGDGQAHRGFHVKSHAGLSGTFTVLEDIPPEARYGVFKTPRTFQAWVRLSNGFSAAMPDWFPDLLGCAVKLLSVEGPKLLDGEEDAQTQDFVALNQPYLPARNAAELMIISTASGNVLTAPIKIIMGMGWSRGLRVILWTLGWTPHRLLLSSIVTEDFHGVAPITIGPHAVKFTWRSHQTAAPRPSGASLSNYLRADLAARLAQGDLKFDFLVQFYVDPVKTPIDGASEWKAADAPYVKLAELTLGRRDLESVESKQNEHRLNALSFNPWHALAEHRPLGNIQRARRMIYQGSAKYRARETDPSA